MTIYKESPLENDAPYGSKSEVIDFSERNALEKIASSDTHIPEKLASAIRDIQASPDPNFVYLYDRALGAGEVYGPNNNGDWFGKGELMAKHATFKTHAHLFRHHQNKDPNNKIGDVLESEYNGVLDTVDLIVKAPIEKVAADLKRLESGHVLATSMGARVKADECSVCGNRASTRLAYCTHLRNQMLRIYPDGRQVFARNPDPKFVDISIVVIPADPSSAVLRKVANLQQKNAEIKKNDIGFSSDNNLFEGENREIIRPEVISATNNYERADVLATLHAAKGILRPDEFQAVIRKDASLLRPDIIPYVQVERVEKTAMAGKSLYKLAFAIEKVAGIPLDAKSKLVCADFLDPFEKRAYLMYRKSLNDFSKIFLR